MVGCLYRDVVHLKTALVGMPGDLVNDVGKDIFKALLNYICTPRLNCEGHEIDDASFHV